jgi:hypothetical protein
MIYFVYFIFGLEVAAQIIFALLKRFTVAASWNEVFARFWFEFIRGILERAVLAIGIFSGFPQVLIPFGVLKLQNRIGLERDGNKEDREKENARAYFLMGNMLTILIALIYVLVATYYFGLAFSVRVAG